MKAKQHKPPWPPPWAALPDDDELERLSQGDQPVQLRLPLDPAGDRQRRLQRALAVPGVTINANTANLPRYGIG